MRGKVPQIPEDSISTNTVTNRSKWWYRFCRKNATVFDKLIQCLDDRSLLVIWYAKDSGQKALAM